MKYLLKVFVVSISLLVASSAVMAQSPELGAYTARAALLPIGSDPEHPSAELSYFSYTLDGADSRERPVTFLWNGGPGASSIFLHLAALGPMTVATPGDGSFPPVPAHLEENPHTWLHFTDLVFVDPVGTGYSRALPKADGSPGDPKPFWEIESDMRSLAQFIQRYLSENNRWLSPKAIAGESYGGYRVAGMVKLLLTDYEINLNRAIMISPAMHSSITNEFDRYGLISNTVHLPSFVATAAAQGRNDLPAEGDAFIAAMHEVENYALTGYLPKLALTGRMSDEEEVAFYDEVAAKIGLDPALVRQRRARVDMGTFALNLLRDKAEVIDRYDGTQSSPNPVPEIVSPFGIKDRSLTALQGILTPPFQHYVRNTLGFETPRRYHVLNPVINPSWNRSSTLGDPTDVDFALSQNPDLKILVVHGYHDLVTPYFQSRYLLEQSVLSDAARSRLYFGTYPGGHMFYLKNASRAEMFKDVKGFYERGKN